MAQSYRSRFLSAQRQSETALKALYAQLADAIAAELTRRADADGNIPRSATFDIQQAAGDLVRRLFLGRNRQGEWAPFDTLPNGTVIPLSPYMRQLWESIRAVVRIPVEQNAAILAKRLPADVAYVMQRAVLNPFAVAKGEVSEQVFRPNPLAAYEAPHTWVDPNGYRLSDRVWNVATLTRRQIDAFMEEGIREGKGALQMSRELRQFLTPGESLRRTDKPYGTSASFSGMRLARTEITRSSNEAHRTSAAMNPFVSGMKWNLSARHPRIDICDDYARGGPNGDGVYAIEDYPTIPHPQCLCRSSNVLIEDPDAVLEQLRADIQAAKQEFVNLVGPLEVDRFTKLLLGQGLEEARVAPGVTRVIVPPPVIVPPVVQPIVPPTPPPVVVQPVVPAFDPDDPVQVRARIREIGRATSRRSDELEEQIITTAQEQKALETKVKNLSIDYERRKNTEQATQAQRAFEAARQEYTAKSATMTRLLTEQNQLRVEEQRQCRDLTSVRDPANLRVPANSPANWQEGVGNFNRLVSRSVITDAPPTFAQIKDGERGYYDTLRRRINVAANDEERTIVHELGHWLEETNPDILRQALAFYDRRTVGYNEEWLGPGYPATETSKKDKFLHEYMGKTYGRDATEIVSMGIEWMHLRPAELAARDPDMFDFIFRLARAL